MLALARELTCPQDLITREEIQLVKRSDKDFGELVYRQGRVHAGVIFLARLAGLSSNQKAEIMSAALATRGAELVGSFSVVSPGRFAFGDAVLRRRA